MGGWQSDQMIVRTYGHWMELGEKIRLGQAGVSADEAQVVTISPYAKKQQGFSVGWIEEDGTQSFESRRTLEEALKFAAGQLEEQIPVRSRDEIGQLATDGNVGGVGL